MLQKKSKITLMLQKVVAMKVKIVTLANKAAGEIELNPSVFDLPDRPDLLHRMVEYQRAKARAGTHKVKSVGEVSGRKGKPFRQKGTGRARQGSMRSAQFRGGATVFGPVVRSHAVSLNKKIRKLALKTALSMKLRQEAVIIIDKLENKDGKTKSLKKDLASLKLNSVLFVDGEAVNDNVKRATSNVPHVDVLPEVGLNVLDILRHETLVLTKTAVERLEARLA